MVIKQILCWAGSFVFVSLLAIGCAGQEPILIGFAGELTGPRADLGVDARDGAQLAIDLINEQGGIRGHPLKLIVEDDKGDPEIARQVDEKLVEQGVTAVIGHITSEQTAAVLAQMNRAGVVLLSPASSSSEFSGQADYFFRVVPDTGLIGKALAIYMFKSRHIRKLTGIYDLNNRAFAEPLWQVVQSKFTELGGKVEQSVIFVSGETDLRALMAEVAASKPDALVFIASPVDTALMIQYGRQQGLAAPLFSSSWAQSPELLAKGGRAVDGLELVAGYFPQYSYPAFKQFAGQYEARYGRPPSMLSSNGYEAVLALAEGLKQTQGETAGLSEALVTIKNLEGVRGAISLDEFGDVARDVYILRIEGGQFVLLETILPTAIE